MVWSPPAPSLPAHSGQPRRHQPQCPVDSGGHGTWARACGCLTTWSRTRVQVPNPELGAGAGSSAITQHKPKATWPCREGGG